VLVAAGKGRGGGRVNPFVVGLDAVARAPSAVTIGTFDGVHRGHQALVERTAERARDEGLRALAVTFEPPPGLVLRPAAFPGRLCVPAERDAALLAAGADGVVVVPFTSDTAALSPEAFVGRLVERAGLRLLVVGEDFALGRGRAGDVARLREIGASDGMGFAVEAIGRIAFGPEPLSSTAIRAAIREGDVAKARRLLGRPFRVSGEVIHGRKLGRTIGFPTANVMPPADLVPLADGIYASWAWLPGDASPRPAITYVGNRPTVNTGARLVETHLLDFDGDLYGQELRVDVLERLRPDAEFPSLDALIAQMRVDEAQARAILAGEGAVAAVG
jgi:riboflavin kinase/FMN adenylyltransferase